MILQQEIDKNSEPEDDLITQMVDQIEYPLFSSFCESINN